MRARSRREPERKLQRICGLAAVRALFARDPDRVERLFFETRLAVEVAPLCRHLAERRKPYREVAADELARVAGTVLHGGVAAVARLRPLPGLERSDVAAWGRDGRPLVVLDGIGNPHNLGAIARSAAFFGWERLVLADRPEQALPSDASYRVAEGGLEHMSLYHARLPQALRWLKPAFHVVGTALERGVAPEVVRNRPVALVLGNEETGLAAATLAVCDTVVNIPGSGRVQSLNVAAAAAVLFYALGGS